MFSFSVLWIYCGTLLVTLTISVCDEVDSNRILGEYENCDHIIPKFISQVMSKPESSCEESGNFPKPGNCSVFFKCVQSDARIQPLIEYCATGYNFVNGVCVPNRNMSDCPQYTCRIPEVINPIGNEIELDNSNHIDENKDIFSPSPLMSTPSSVSAPAPTSSLDPITSGAIETTSRSPEEDHVHSEQLMSDTQAQPEKSSSSGFSGSLFLILVFNLSFTFLNVRLHTYIHTSLHCLV